MKSHSPISCKDNYGKAQHRNITSNCIKELSFLETNSLPSKEKHI